jgi:hypothetical protein
MEIVVATFRSTGILALVGILAAATPSYSAHGEDNPWSHASVIELFTSQGCASCPEADQLLEQLSHRPDVIALSFPVSYWDYLGWKDTLARPENTERQRTYAKVLGEGVVYTPQAIVNGVRNCIGGDREQIEAAVEDTAPVVGKDAVPIYVRRQDGKLMIDVGAASAGSGQKKGKVWVATVQPPLEVPIKRGENAGAVLTYTNVVRKLTEAGDWEGSATSYALPIDSVAREGEALVVFVQAPTLRIVGATRAGE